MAYLVPAMLPPALHETGQVIRRSRFLAQGSRCRGREEARALVARIRALHGDATHHCWAYVAGAPGCTADVGSSDDGEPHGTAGRPMLHALLHSGIGEICVVVSRWFGGIKLGTGGLMRAYSEGVVANTATMPTVLADASSQWKLVCGYADLAPLKRALDALGATRRGETFAEEVTLDVQVPEGLEQDLRRAVSNATCGRGRLVLLGMSEPQSGTPEAC